MRRVDALVRLESRNSLKKEKGNLGEEYFLLQLSVVLRIGDFGTDCHLVTYRGGSCLWLE